MKFRKIIQSAKSAYRELRLRFLCIAQQQAEEGYRRLQTTVEELRETIVLLQKRIEALESQLNKTNKRLADYQANAATNEKLETLGKKFTAELEKLDDKRMDDNKKIKDGLEELKKMISRPPDNDSKPGDINGKRGGENDNRATKSQPPQCRFVCYEENNGRWAVALAVEEGQEVQSVRQGKEITANDGRYILEDISAEVTVEFKGEHSSKVLNLFDEHNDEHKFVVFKMRKDWQGEGQRVKTLSSGEYIVFAHESCGKRIGTPPTEPGQCRYPDFTAHFFFLSEDSEMNDRFKNCSLPSSTKRFSLKRKSIADDSDLGELFGDDAPQLIDAEEWQGTSWIVVGRENGGKALAKFRPEEKTIHPKEIPLAEVLGERSGWFFVRIYDAKVKLLDSFDFRRAKGLKNIFINNQPLGEVAPIVPAENGHTKTIVQFGGNLSVHPKNDSNGICEEPEKENAFAVLPHPDNDGTKWVLGSGEDCVEAEILLPRIWWKFIEEKGKEGDWRDTPIEMEREKFRGAENEKIRIRLPLSIPEIVVGFNDLNSTDNPTFRTKLSTDRKTREVEFRIDSFADYQAIEKRIRKAMDLRVILKVKDRDIIFPIVRIPADADSLEGCNLRELKRAKEELYQEGLMAAAKAAKEFENSVRESTLKMAIRFDNDKGDIVLTISFDPQRKSMLARIVKKLKAFFKKHFEKE